VSKRAATWESFHNAMDWVIVCGLGVALATGVSTAVLAGRATGAQADPLFAILSLVLAAAATLCLMAVAVPLLALTTWLAPVKADGGEDQGIGGRD
jgi:hypothetical protein